MKRPTPPKRVAVFGCTGSVGSQCLEIIRLFPDQFQVCALGAGGSQKEKLLQLTQEFSPEYVVVPPNSDIPNATTDPNPAIQAADVIVLATGGSAGLPIANIAFQSGKIVLLANKESLVIGGRELLKYSTRKRHRYPPRRFGALRHLAVPARQRRPTRAAPFPHGFWWAILGF